MKLPQLAADAPVLDQLESLNLSMGSLRDTGGEALLASEKIRGLKRLDLHHHFMSDEVVSRFQALELEVDLSQQEEAHEYSGETYYYTAVGE